MVLAAFLSTCSHLACQLLLLPNLYPGWGCSNQGIEPGSPDLQSGALPLSYCCPDLISRSKNPSAPKCPRSTFMQHCQVPSVEYSSYINHVISMGWLRTTLHICMPAAPQTAPLPSERPLIKPADICLDWWMISSQCQPLPLVCTV